MLSALLSGGRSQERPRERIKQAIDICVIELNEWVLTTKFVQQKSVFTLHHVVLVATLWQKYNNTMFVCLFLVGFTAHPHNKEHIASKIWKCKLHRE